MTRPWLPVAAVVAVSAGVVLVETPASTWPTTATLSLASGVAALALMATAAILGGRWSWLEGLFGGLDRVYEVHKQLAIAALVFASVHLLFKAGIREWETAAILALPGEWTRFVRQASFVGLMLIVMLALNRSIPYSTWRWWHHLSGPLFVVAVLHWLSIRSPLPLASPAGVWLAVLSALGCAAAIYKLFLYPFIADHAEYRIVDVTRGPSAVKIELEPIRRRITFRPGQFGFLRMKVDGLRELHPFTIAAAATPTGRISFIIRALGDYTQKLTAMIQPGALADIYAPYGRFERSPLAEREIWIAGGVGISPFLAWLEDTNAEAFERVSLFYFYTPGRVFPEIDALRALAARKGIEFMPVSTGPATPAFVERFTAIVRDADPARTDVALCGPAGLLHAVRALAVSAGLDPSQIRHERFEFR